MHILFTIMFCCGLVLNWVRISNPNVWSIIQKKMLPSWVQTCIYSVYSYFGQCFTFRLHMHTSLSPKSNTWQLQVQNLGRSDPPLDLPLLLLCNQHQLIKMWKQREIPLDIIHRYRSFHVTILKKDTAKFLGCLF